MKKAFLWLFIICTGSAAFAHPMPSSVVELSVLDNHVRGEAKIPLLELGNAVGDNRTANLADPFFKAYFTQHIQAITAGKSWSTQVENISVSTDKDPFVGVYKEVIVHFTLTPPDAKLLHRFTFNYDAVMHQVVTHSALVYVKQDWSNGLQADNEAQQIGVIHMDVPTEKIYPLQVNLENGTWWKGFKGMLSLGMDHIKEGTDHLLFLIVLLLPAMLLTNGKQWGAFGGVKYSVLHLLKIVTAFTIGHSVTLLVGALGFLHLPSQPVEVLIAFSILVSAVHAVRPIFPGRETAVAAGFGLVHGLAFASVLTNLELSPGKLALSILGFNLGIELMQLLVIVSLVPWLILLSKTGAYKWLRTIGATLAGLAAVVWIIQRTSNKPNAVTAVADTVTQYGLWLVIGLALVTLIIYGFTYFEKKWRSPFNSAPF